MENQFKLAKRKYTTKEAKGSVLEFLQSFDFSDFKDLPIIESKSFIISWKPTSNSEYAHSAKFALIDGKLYCYPIWDYQEDENKKQEPQVMLDDDCTFISFKGVLEAFEELVNLTNQKSEAKDKAIEEYLNFYANYKAQVE